VLFVLAAAYFLVTGRRHGPPDTREPSPYVVGAEQEHVQPDVQPDVQKSENGTP
jgi:hypothetical protein